jgi:hypothetical protein
MPVDVPTVLHHICLPFPPHLSHQIFVVPLHLQNVDGQLSEFQDAGTGKADVERARKVVGLHVLEGAAVLVEVPDILGPVVHHKGLEVLLLLATELGHPRARVVHRVAGQEPFLVDFIVDELLQA